MLCGSGGMGQGGAAGLPQHLQTVMGKLLSTYATKRRTVALQSSGTKVIGGEGRQFVISVAHLYKGQHFT